MTSPDVDFARYAGFVRFPAGVDELTDATRCAACFAPLPNRVCAACGLDHTHPDISVLRDQSRATADLLRDRLVTIGRIRHDTAAGRMDAEAAPHAVPTVVPVAAPVIVPVSPAPDLRAPVLPAPVPPARDLTALNLTAPDLPAPVSPVPVARRSSVQVLLLGVGVALLAIAAIFFMIFAFVAFGVFVRALIIGAITAATVAGATLLRRRNLVGTAEAVSALAIVLVLLDVWALQANGLFGLDRVDVAIYWGLALILTAVALRGWRHLSGLRTPAIAGAAMLPLGAGIAVAGIADAAGSFDATFFGAVAIALAALAHPVFAPRAGDVDARTQRFILLAWAVVGLGIGLFSVLDVAPFFAAGVSVGLLALAATAIAHAIVLARFTEPSVWAGRAVAAASALGAVLIALAPAALALRSDGSVIMIAVPVLGAAAVALGLEAALLRTPAGARSAISLSAICTAVIAGVFALTPLAIGVFTALQVLALAFSDTRQLTLGDAPQAVTADAVTAIVTLAILAIAVCSLWLAVQRRSGRAPFACAFALLVITLAVPLLALFGAIVAAWLVASAAGVAWMLRRGVRVGAGSAVGTIVAQFAALNLALAFVAAWAGQHTWWVVSLVAIALLLVARMLVARPPVAHSSAGDAAGRAALLGTALAVAFLAVAGLGGLGSGTSVLSSALPSASALTGVIVRDTAAGLLALAIIAVIAAALPLAGLLSELDRRTLFWLSAVVAAASTAVLIVLVPLSATPLWMLLGLGVVLLVALVVWSLAPATRALVPERIVAAIAFAPAVSWMLQSFVRVLGVEELLGGVSMPLGVASSSALVGGGVVGATAALLVSAAALVGTLRSAPVVARSFTDVGIALVLFIAVVDVAAGGAPLGWLTLLVAGVAVLLQSISADGLFASRSARRLVGWIAFGLGVSALWLRLFDSSVTEIEPFTLPVAAGLLVIAALIERVEHRRPGQSTVAPSIVLAALLLALLPSALEAVTGTALRAVVIVAIAGSMLLAARWIALPQRARPFALVAAVAGAAAVAIAGLGRALALPLLGGTGPRHEPIELWAVASCAILFAAALAYTRRRNNDAGDTRMTVALFLAAGTGLLVVEGLRLGAEPGATLRALTLVVVFAGLHVVAMMTARLPARLLLSWLALGYAVIAALVGWQAVLLDPIEAGSLPIALALLISGSWRLLKNPALRSYPAVGPGLLVLFVPSLLMTTVDRDLWRIVLIGIVAVLVIVAGVLLRLQAPFVIGSIVVVIHAIGTFSPQIRFTYEATPWWLWVAIGGALLLFIGATYERRARDLRRTVGRIAALR